MDVAAKIPNRNENVRRPQVGRIRLTRLIEVCRNEIPKMDKVDMVRTVDVDSSVCRIPISATSKRNVKTMKKSWTTKGCNLWDAKDIGFIEQDSQSTVQTRSGREEEWNYPGEKLVYKFDVYVNGGLGSGYHFKKRGYNPGFCESNRYTL